jgi:tagatose-6-phosphate ketose/aldose isomerase
MSDHIHSATASATWAEIHAQPQIWREFGAGLDVAGLRAWIAAQDVSEVWLCGAGSSAYIGDIIAAGLLGQNGPAIRAMATTDIVSRPYAHLRGARRLVISFGRSGNSAESIGLLDALDALAPGWPRLNITCNGASAMAGRAGCRVLILPKACHDAGFAMTSSFSTMLLAALAVLEQSLPAGDAPARFAALADDLAALLPQYTAQASALPLPARAVFIGTGALAMAAREAALKVMELSGGQIPALWDSALGFRHGPKSFVQAGTQIWLFGHPDAHARAYEHDLCAELKAQFPAVPLHRPTLPRPWGEAWAAPLYVAQAQLAAVLFSARLGLNIDDPFAGLGTLTRVVAHVPLHKVGAR